MFRDILNTSFLYKDLLNKHHSNTPLQTGVHISNMPSLLHIELKIPKDRDLIKILANCSDDIVNGVMMVLFITASL